MTEIKTRGGDRVLIKSVLPIKDVLKLEINHKLNDHGSLFMKVMISEENQKNFIQTSFQEGKISVFDEQDESTSLIFCGKITKTTCELKNQVLIVSVYGISYSVELDLEKKRRSFQQKELTFEAMAGQVTEDSGARFLWQFNQNKPIGRPFVQYQETDWEFLRRIASHFQGYLVPSLTSDRPDFYIGIKSGVKRSVKDSERLEWGVSDAYYQNGGYMKGRSREDYRYLRLKHDASWEIGDTVMFQNRQYTVFERKIDYAKGELVFLSTLGTRGLLQRKVIYPDQLVGSRLQGIIKKVEAESVFVQFDFDQEEGAHHPWPWVPEVGNLAYLMPEVGSRAVLFFPNQQEQDAVAIQLQRINSNSSIYQDTEQKSLTTLHDKMLGLYSEQLVLRGKEEAAKISMMDGSGIQLETKKKIELKAKGRITLQTRELSVQAPNQILLQNAKGNMELCQDFNFFAPEGVRTSSARGQELELEPLLKGKKEDDNHWALSYSALGSVVQLDPGKIDHDAVIDLVAVGSVPQIGQGQGVVAMSEVMAGKQVEATQFPEVFSSFNHYTFKGGYRLPVDDE